MFLRGKVKKKIYLFNALHDAYIVSYKILNHKRILKILTPLSKYSLIELA